MSQQDGLSAAAVLPVRVTPVRPIAQPAVATDLGVIDGSRPDGSCEILGTGPVPPSVLDNLSPDAFVCGVIFGGKGECCGWVATSGWATVRNGWPPQYGARGAYGATPPFTAPSCTICGIGVTAFPPILTIWCPCVGPTIGSCRSTTGELVKNWKQVANPSPRRASSSAPPVATGQIPRLPPTSPIFAIGACQAVRPSSEYARLRRPVGTG